MSAEMPAAQTAEPAVWHCDLCGFAYDASVGNASEGFAPGTLWADVPESWGCPDCGQAKADFVPLHCQ